jgi:mono/diheme cytochrome c family protein
LVEVKTCLHAIALLLLAVCACAAMGEIERWNCAACHALSEKQAAWLLPNAAPRLSDTGSRISPEWLRQFLALPHETFPGTAMPDLLHGDAEKVNALTHYFVSLGQAKYRRVMPDKAAVARGEILYHRIGCVACHAPLNGAAAADSVPLPVIEEKWSLEGLRRFLVEPLASHASGRMPSMNLTDSEAADIAHYLLRKTRVPAAAEVTFYRGRVRSLEELDSAEMARTLPATGLALEGPTKDRGVVLRISTWLNVEREGDYTFFMKATGSGRLSIDGEWIIGTESWEPEKVNEKRTIRLRAGKHEVKLDYVHRGRNEPALSLEWEGPGIGRGAVSPSLLSSEREPAAEVPSFTVDQSKAEKGREYFATLGCATCHESKAPTSPLPALAALNPARGCLAEKLSASVPNFHFDASEREALRKALAELNNPALAAPTAEERVAHTMNSFRCTACHVRDGKGGVSEERGAFFTSNVDDLGDEGRLPPNLDGVGDKLRPDRLAKVLAEGAGVRPYLNTRMPKFGAGNIGHLAEPLIALDRQATLLPPVNDTRDIQREAGRKITGTDGLSCIACHRFNRQPAHTLQVVDLLTTTERLNEDWFRRFLRDPNRYHPGTRMPPLWPGGRSLLPALLDGDTDRQHAALWTYFSDGPQAKFPEGLSRQNMEIVVGGEAGVYRGKLWEAGFRAVAIGYPGQLNAAFDAEEMRLALLWRGRFLNVGAHWDVQGMGQIRPLGTQIIAFPHGSPLAVLPTPDAPWPAESSKALGMKFRGYRIDPLHQPTLTYDFGLLAVEDFIAPAPSGRPAIHRTLNFSGAAPEGLHLRLAAGKCTPDGANTWRVNDALTVKVVSADAPILRGAAGKQELTVPIRPHEDKARLEVDYAW